MARSHLGQIFISHTSVDKPFVRRLEKRLRGEGYDTWLDEHQMVAGDPLGAKIADALRRARVVLIVVSESSVKSKWLRYELNIATDRMVTGECRVIPVVIGDVEPPAEVMGLLYADFRKAFKYGFRSVLTALQYENQLATSEAAFWRVATDVVQATFGAHGYASLDGEYSSRSYDLVFVPVPSDDDPDSTAVVFDTVPAYIQPAKPLTEEWFRDFRSSMEELSENIYFVATERPIAFEVIAPDPDVPQVSYRESSLESIGPYAYAVFADLSGTDREEWSRIIKRANKLIVELAPSLVRTAV